MSLFSPRVYLDWAASAPVSARAQRVFRSAVRTFGNPSSPHAEGVEARRMLEEARTKIARFAEVRLEGVVFTSGATEANNLLVKGHMRALETKAAHLLYLPGAHSSVVNTVKELEKEGTLVEEIELVDGRIDLAYLKKQIRPTTALVILDAVCGETGTQFDTRGVRNVLREAGSSARIHVDASQAPLCMPFDLTRLDADSVALDAQKVGGIRGVGALCMRKQVRLHPLMQGGGQEKGRRPGTETVALAAAFAEALTEASEKRIAFMEKAREQRAELIRTVTSAIPDAAVNEGREGTPHILNLSFPGRDTDYAVMLLDREGFAVSSRSACETESTEGSRAVLALTGDARRAQATLRVSWGPGTPSRSLKRFARVLISTIRFLDTA